MRVRNTVDRGQCKEIGSKEIQGCNMKTDQTRKASIKKATHKEKTMEGLEVWLKRKRVCFASAKS
jgi:hypothetical protein